MDVSLSPQARAIVIWIAAIVGALILLKSAHALTPFAWAIITAYILHPLVAWIHRRTRLPKQLITAWLYAIIGLVVAILFINLSPQIISQLNSLQQRTIPNVISDVNHWFEERQRLDTRFAGVDVQFIEERLQSLSQQLAGLVGAKAVPLLLSTVAIALEILIYLIASFYFIVYGDKFVESIRDALSRRYHREFDRVLVDINATLGNYLRGQVVLVVIMSIASYIALRTFSVDYALSLAIATGFLELIPLIGPWTAGTIAVTIAFFQETTPFGWSNGTLAIVIAVTYFALRQLEDAFVIPLVIGRIVHLHPLLVIFVLVIGTSLGGPLGLILAVPIAAVIKILASFFYEKIRAREHRRIEVIRSRADLERARERFPDLMNATVVLLIEGDALSWADLDLMTEVAGDGLDHAINLTVVTLDGVAGALAAAAGIATTAIPIGPERLDREYGDMPPPNLVTAD
jgi:predicted PurR-regulated permease PerM